MRFEWNQAKNEGNIRRHGSDFADVEDMFNHSILTLSDNRGDYGEERWIAIGRIRSLEFVVV